MRRSILGCLVGVVAFGLLASLPSVAEEIIYFQELVRRIPVTDHVLEYAVKLAAKTRPGREKW